MAWRFALLGLGLLACDGSGGSGSGSDAPTTGDDGGDGGGGGGGGGASSLSDFVQQLNAAMCDQYFACWGEPTLDSAGFETVEDCYAAAEAGSTATVDTSDCPAFDASAADACLNEMEALSCEAFEALWSSGELPATCSEESLCGT